MAAKTCRKIDLSASAYLLLSPLESRHLGPVPTSLPDSVSAAQGERANGRRRPHCSAGDEAATVDHKQIANIVCLVPRIHRGSLWIISHPRCAHEVAGPGVRFAPLKVISSCGAEAFARPP